MFNRMKSICCIQYYIQLQTRRCQLNFNQTQEKIVLQVEELLLYKVLHLVTNQKKQYKVTIQVVFEEDCEQDCDVIGNDVTGSDRKGVTGTGNEREIIFRAFFSPGFCRVFFFGNTIPLSISQPRFSLQVQTTG